MWSLFFCQRKVEQMPGVKYRMIWLKLTASKKVQELKNSTVVIGSLELKI